MTLCREMFISPVMLIFADHLEVPSSTLCLICFICVLCVVLSRPNTSWICSKISGLFLSLIFMRSFKTMMMFWVRSSAPCLELFSAAPDQKDEWRRECRKNSSQCKTELLRYLILTGPLLSFVKSFPGLGSNQKLPNIMAETAPT